jgi:large subunit ribosomal protein L31
LPPEPGFPGTPDDKPTTTNPKLETRNSSLLFGRQIIPGALFFDLRSLSLQSFKREKIKITMKKGIHPDYKDVIFWDTSSDTKIKSRSTQHSKETIKWEDGKDYPVIKVEVSSASHPFFTGKKLFMDTAGRVEKFKNKYQKKA